MFESLKCWINLFWSGPSLDRVFVKANERSAGRWDDQWNTAYGFWVSLYNHPCTLILLRWVDKKPSNRIPQIVIYWWFTNGRSKTSPPQIQVYRLYSNQPCLVSSHPPSPTFRLQLFQGHVLPEFGRFGYQWRQETFGRGVCWWFQTSWTSGKFDYVPGFPRYRD